jgi:hypothetical protein
MKKKAVSSPAPKAIRVKVKTSTRTHVQIAVPGDLLIPIQKNNSLAGNQETDAKPSTPSPSTTPPTSSQSGSSGITEVYPPPLPTLLSAAHNISAREIFSISLKARPGLRHNIFERSARCSRAPGCGMFGPWSLPYPWPVCFSQELAMTSRLRRPLRIYLDDR